jgi:hypothetical protein
MRSDADRSTRRQFGVLGLILILTSCERHSDIPGTAEPKHINAAELGRSQTTRVKLMNMLDTVTPRPDIIEASYFIYPHGSEAGFRLYIRLDARNWLELWSSGRRIKMLAEGRGYVNGEHGTIVLRLGDKPELQIQAFMPDASSRLRAAYFMVYTKGIAGPWQELGMMNVLK